ncbi:MAG: hypothetical protein ACJAYE_003711 [Candidatus Azotimanducaceae bacterium]
MGRIVIAVYKPKAGMVLELEELMKTHVSILRSEGLATDREAIMMQGLDGTIIEVFEWVSTEAIESAHENPAVLAMWQKYSEVCDYTPISQVSEAQHIFSEFTPLA